MSANQEEHEAEATESSSTLVKTSPSSDTDQRRSHPLRSPPRFARSVSSNLKKEGMSESRTLVPMLLQTASSTSRSQDEEDQEEGQVSSAARERDHSPPRRIRVPRPRERNHSPYIQPNHQSFNQAITRAPRAHDLPNHSSSISRSFTSSNSYSLPRYSFSSATRTDFVSYMKHCKYSMIVVTS